MSLPTLLTLAFLLGTYCLEIAGLAWVLQRFSIFKSRSVFLSFLTFGLVTGLLALALWPMDTSVYPNFPAAWLGDWAYIQAIEWIGDPHSAQAAYTIPWLLRVPQVHALTSCALAVALGAAAQWLYNRRPTAAVKARSESPSARNKSTAG